MGLFPQCYFILCVHFFGSKQPFNLHILTSVRSQINVAQLGYLLGSKFRTFVNRKCLNRKYLRFLPYGRYAEIFYGFFFRERTYYKMLIYYVVFKCFMNSLTFLLLEYSSFRLKFLKNVK